MRTRYRNVLCAVLAAAIAAAVLTPSFDALCDRSFAWHMTQHLVLFFIVPFLVLLADPFHAVLAIAGKRRTAALVRFTEPLRALASPPVALVLFVGALWSVHFSPLYEASLENEWVHVLEHIAFVMAGTIFWLPVLAPPPVRPVPFPVRLFYLMIALPQGALLAVAIDSARAPLYEHYARISGAAAALSDQSNAAAVMWIGGGMMVFAAFIATAAAWGARERRALNGRLPGEPA